MTARIHVADTPSAHAAAGAEPLTLQHQNQEQAAFEQRLRQEQGAFEQRLRQEQGTFEQRLRQNAQWFNVHARRHHRLRVLDHRPMVGDARDLPDQLCWRHLRRLRLDCQN